MNLLPVGLAVAAIWYYFRDTAEQVADQVKFNVLEFGIDKKRTNLKQITFIAKFRVINPTSTNITINSIIGDVQIGTNEMPFSMLTPVTIDRRTTRDIPIKIEVSAINAGQLVALLIKRIADYTRGLRKAPLKATIDGHVNLNTGRINFVEEKSLSI